MISWISEVQQSNISAGYNLLNSITRFWALRPSWVCIHFSWSCKGRIFSSISHNAATQHWAAHPPQPGMEWMQLQISADNCSCLQLEQRYSQQSLQVPADRDSFRSKQGYVWSGKGLCLLGSALSLAAAPSLGRGHCRVSFTHWKPWVWSLALPQEASETTGVCWPHITFCGRSFSSSPSLPCAPRSCRLTWALSKSHFHTTLKETPIYSTQSRP